MREQVYAAVRELISNYIDIQPMDLDMDADLDLVYDMDSTEMIEFAKKLNSCFGVNASQSDRASWSTANSICEFVLAKTHTSPISA